MTEETPEELVAKIREAAKSGRIMYQCCFCKEGVPLGPLPDGSVQHWCEWCGLRYQTKPTRPEHP